MSWKLQSVCRSFPPQQVISDGKGHLHSPTSPKPAGHFPARKLCLQSFPSPFLKAFPSTASNPACVESELKKRKQKETDFMSATAATDTAPNSNPSFLEKEMKQKQKQGRAMCLLPGLPAAPTTEMFGSIQSSNSIPFTLLYILHRSCSPVFFRHSAPSCSWGNSHRTFLQNETVSLFPFGQMLVLNQFSFVSSFFCKIDICMPFLGTFSVPADGFRPGQGTSSRPERASVPFSPASV